MVSHSFSGRDGPLGRLVGMTYDPIRERYFWTGEGTGGGKRPATTILDPSRGRRGPTKDAKRSKTRPVIEEEDEAGPSTGRSHGRRVPRGRARRDDPPMRMLSERLQNLQMVEEVEVGMCNHELVTFFHTYGDLGLYALTDQGNVLILERDGKMNRFGVCGSKLRASHRDLMRAVSVTITDGPEAHCHLIRRENHVANGPFSFEEMDLPHPDVFSVSSFDDRFTVGSTKSLVTVTYEQQFGYTQRRVPSDPLAIHHVDDNLVFAGLRNSHVRLDDLRIPSHLKNDITSSIGRKAIVHVQRLKDSAVPFGLVVSAMNSELMLFDVRFGKNPILRFEGHQNPYYKLGICTSAEDEILVAAGSDRKIRGWSTLTGERIAGVENRNKEDPVLLNLEDTGDKPIVAVRLTPEYGMDIALQGVIRRYKSVGIPYGASDRV